MYDSKDLNFYNDLTLKYNNDHQINWFFYITKLSRITEKKDLQYSKFIMRLIRLGSGANSRKRSHTHCLY